MDIQNGTNFDATLQAKNHDGKSVPKRKSGKITWAQTKTWLEPTLEIPKHELSSNFRKSKMGNDDDGRGVMYGSHGYYNNLLASTMCQVRQLLGEEKRREPMSNPDRRKMYQALADIYFRYLKLFKCLDEVFDQMVHPQKRIVVRKLLDLFIGRILELKGQLVLCENSEVCYFDEIALVEGVLPKELDMEIPKYYFHDPTPEMIQRDQWFVNVQERERRSKEKEEEIQRKLRLKIIEESNEGGIRSSGIWTSIENNEEVVRFEDTMLPVQVMERARQGKGRFLIAKYYYEEDVRYRRKKTTIVKQSMDADRAAAVIQKLIRGFLARHRVRRLRNQEMEFLGMRATASTELKDFKNDYFFQISKGMTLENEVALEGYKENRRKVRKTKQKLYEEAQLMTYQKLHTLEGPDMAERFKHQIRTWMLNVREQLGKFPEIPKAELGGSSLIICSDVLTDDTKIGEDGSPSGTPGEGGKGKKGNKGGKEVEKKVKAKKSGPVADYPTLQAPVYFDEFKLANEEYNKHWRGLSDQDNPNQDFELDHIIREKSQLVAKEIREQVDIAMKAELDYLKQVLEKRKGKKGKKSKGKGKAKGKGKGKKGKRKKGKDLTPDRTMESLFEELVQQNIIREYPKVRLDDLVAQSSFVNGELRSYHSAHPFEKKTEERYMPGDANPLPAFGDVLKAIKDVCIIPLGSVQVHRMAPEVTKSVLICGAPGSGKKTIVNMICTELRATLVDLTSSNIAGKYPGKPGLKMLVHLIEKVGKCVQPVIVLIDHCERTYMKKVPKTDKTEPKRLKKQIGKFLKAITAEDLVLLIGLTSEPWACPFKVMKKDYQRVFYIPLPDYATRFDMWKKTLHVNPDILHPDINYTLLTKLSHGWTVGNIRKACDDVIQRHHKDVAKQLRDRRKDMDPWGHLGNLVIRPTTIGKLFITMDKLVESIGEYDPVFSEQEKLWNSWWNKTPLQRARLATQVKVGGERKEKKKKKGKKKGKK